MNTIKLVYLIFFLQFNLLELKAQDPFIDVNDYYLPNSQIQNGGDCIVACQTFDTLTISNNQYYYQAGIKIFLIRNSTIFVSRIISTHYDTSIAPLGFIKSQNGMKLFSMVEIKNRDVLIRMDEINVSNLEVLNTKYFQSGFPLGYRIDPNRRTSILLKDSNIFGIFNLDTTQYPHYHAATLPYGFKLNITDSFIQTRRLSEFGYEVHDILFEEDFQVFVTGDEMRIIRYDSLLNITGGDTSSNHLYFNTAPYIGKVNSVLADSFSYSMGVADSVFSPSLPLKSKSRIAITKVNVNTNVGKRYSYKVNEVDNFSEDYYYRLGYNKAIFRDNRNTIMLFDYYYRWANLGRENAIFLNVLNDSMNVIGTFRYSKIGKVLRAISATFYGNYAYILLAEFNLNAKLGVCKPSMIIVNLDSLQTGIIEPEINTTSEIYLYPNPSNGQVNIYSNERYNFNSIELIDILGNSYLKDVIDNKFNTSILPKGIYIGILNSGKISKRIKLIID